MPKINIRNSKFFIQYFSEHFR